MANRINTFLIKRSSTPGKIPIAGQLLLGELALNTADAKLYTSGTTANSILPIGWDRVSKTGDTMTGALYAPTISATTISATTYNGYIPYDSTNPNGYISSSSLLTGATGDATGIVLGKSLPLTLATVNSNVGNFGSNTLIPIITVNNKGLITAISATTIPTQISALTLNTSGVIHSTPINFTNTNGAWSGTMSLVNQNANTIFAGPINGIAATPSFRTLVINDIPLLSSLYLPISGGTVTGITNFTNGLTSNTISATTISATTYNGYIPYNAANPNGYITGFTNTYVTGGTYSTGTTIFTNNSGGTFSVTGFSTATTFTGGTVTGTTNFTNGLTSNTISATTISATTYNGYTPANQDGTILYHSVLWFTPSGTSSSIGTSVTSSLGQFTSAMVGAKLTISGESRIISTYSSPTLITVDNAYSQNYSNVPSGGTSWAVYSKSFANVDSANTNVFYDNTGVKKIYFDVNGNYINTSNYGVFNNNLSAAKILTFGTDAGVRFTLTNNDALTDVRLRRISAGLLQIDNGFSDTAYRDLLLRNLTGSTLNITGTTSLTGGLTANTISATTISGGDIDYMLMSSFRNTYNY